MFVFFSLQELVEKTQDADFAHEHNSTKWESLFLKEMMHLI